MSNSREPVVIIGAGMAGLAAALSLGAAGRRVVLLERHATPGGKMRHVEVGGRAFDAGPTVFTMRTVFEALFARAGLALCEQVGLERADLLARHGWVGSEPLDLFADVDASCDAIATFASPREADRYRDFAARTLAVHDTLDATFMRRARPSMAGMTLEVLKGRGIAGFGALLATAPFESLWGHLSKRFEDPRLRQLFGRYATYCGSSPFKAPATLMLIAHVEREGVWLVEGGMHALARAVLGAAEAVGVEARFGAGVARIELEHGRVSAVVLDDGERIATREIVFNGDTESLTRGLLGEPVQGATPARREPSLSAVTRCELATASGFPLAHHSVFFGADYPDEFDAIFRRRGMTADPTVYVCAQDRDGSVAPTGTQAERIFSLINAPARDLDADEIAAADARITATLSRHGLTLKRTEDQAHVGPPNEFAVLFPATDGALYGRPTHGWRGSFARPGSSSRVPGLYLAGGSVHPGAGVPMAALSGQLAAERLLSDNSGSA